MPRSAPMRRPGAFGQAIVEFALLLPVATLLVMIGLDFSRVMHDRLILFDAARAGAETAATTPNPPFSSVAAAVVAEAPDLPITGDSAHVQVTYPGDGTAQTTVRYGFQAITPLISQVWGSGALNVTVSASWPLTPASVLPTPLPTPSAQPTITPTAIPTVAPTPTPIPPATATPTQGPTATATPTATPTSRATATSTSTPTTTPSPTATACPTLQISNIQVIETGISGKYTVSWSTNLAATSTFRWGPNPNSYPISETVTQVTPTTFSTTFNGPGSGLHYQVSATSDAPCSGSATTPPN